MQHNLVDNPTSLSIRIRPDGFSLFVYGEKNHIIAQKTIPANLFLPEKAGLLDRQAEINRAYKRIAIVCETNYYTLVPGIFDDPASYRTLLNLHHPEVDQQWAIFYEQIHQCVLIFGLPRTFVKNMQSRMPDAGFYTHMIHPVRKGFETSGNHLIAYLRDGKTDCMIFSKKNLLFYNSFDSQTDEDVVYHCMHLLDQFQLSPDKTKIHIIGEEGNSRPDRILTAYLPHVTFIPHSVEYENYQW